MAKTSENDKMVDGKRGRAIGDTGKDDPAFFQGQV